MDGIETSNPYLCNGPSCQGFRSSIQISKDRSLRKLPALGTVVAEVLTIQAHSSSKQHNYVIDLTNADIRRSRFNPRKFVIRADVQVLNIFCNSNEDANVWASILVHSSSRRFGDCYRLGQQIAGGRHSKAYLAYAKNDQRSTKYVVKVNNRVAECNSFLARSQFERDAHLQLLTDLGVRESSSPREKTIDIEERKHQELKVNLFIDKIVTLRDSFGTPTEDFLVFQYEDGEVLSTVLSKYGPLSERDARIIMWDLLTAMHFIHEKGIVHRDVCASNVFYWNQRGKARVKLFDFSEARLISDNIPSEEPFRDSPGKEKYKALEILSDRYHGKPADIWACGVLLYRVLSGAFPFQGDTESELAQNIKNNALSESLFAAPVWSTISSEAVLLIKQMLQPDPFKRPSALGARSHQWFNNEFRQAGMDKSRYGKRQHVPQRLQGPVRNIPLRQNRAASTSNKTALPVPFQPAVEEELTEDEERLELSVNKEEREEVSSRESPQTSKLPCDDGVSHSRPSSTLEEQGESNVSFVTSIAQVFRLDSCRKVASTVVEGLTKLQASLKDFRLRKFLGSDDSTDPSEADLEIHVPGSDIQAAEPQESRRNENQPQETIDPLTTSFPDRERITGSAVDCIAKQEVSTLPWKRQTLTHHCNHLCSYRPCTRSALIARGDRLLKSRSGSNPARSAVSNLCSSFSTTSGLLQPSTQAPDRAICLRQQQRGGSASEIVPITRCLDDDVFLWAKGTKLFSGFNLERAPIDPLFFYRRSSSADGDTRTENKENLTEASSHWKHCEPPIPLCDEMCVGTHMLKSVVAAAHVGLPQFWKKRPIAAKLLLGSPTAQLHLSMILPYRRKFRSAGLALVSMFRIISLEKGLCLTKRIARGQQLPPDFFTHLTDIRRDYRSQPLHAQVPSFLPSDKFTGGPVWRKDRPEPRPNIPAIPQSFWSRQRELKNGIFMNAWKFVKKQAKTVRNILSLRCLLDNADDTDDTDRMIFNTTLVCLVEIPKQEDDKEKKR